MGNTKFNPGRCRRPEVCNRSNQRKLGLQSLENRNLLAADVGIEIYATDVNGDGDVTPVDVLQVVNALHTQKEGRVVEDIAAVDVNKDGVLSPRDALGVINQMNSEGRLRQQSETPLRDRLVEQLSDRDPTKTLGSGAIREIAQRLAEKRGVRAVTDGLRELVNAARNNGEVTGEERAEIRERVSTELAARGLDGSNLNSEWRERLQELREKRREQLDTDFDSQQREQLRERFAARRAITGAFGRFLRG